MPGELYVLQTGLLTRRALLRLQSSQRVVAEGSDEDAVALARDGLRVAWMVPEKPSVPDDLVWEYVAAGHLEPHGTCPLDGIGVVVTRPRHQADDLVTRLELLGARAYAVPSIELRPPASFEVLDRALDDPAAFDWLVFTSANAVDPFWSRLKARGRDVRRLSRVRVATIGPATATAVERIGLVPDLVPAEYVAEALLEALPGDVSGQRFLIPRAAEARDVLPQGLRARGAEVVVAPVYETVAADSGAVLADLFRRGLVDVVTFTASSTVRHFAVEPPPGVKIVCIGPVTARSARERGWQVDAQPAEYTTDGLVAQIVSLYR